MSHTLRRLASVAFAGAALFATSFAFAGENGTIVLADGTSLGGEIIEIVQGDHLALRLPNGEIRTVQWAQIASMQVGASGSVVIGPGGSPTPPPPQPIPPPAPVVEPAPTSPPPPPVVYAPPPPQVTPPYDAAPPPPPPERFTPRWTFGGRIGPMWPGKNGQLVGATNNGADGNGVSETSYVSSGLAVEGDFGYHFSPAWTFYGFWEHGFLGRGDLNSGADLGASSDFVGVGFDANTNPKGPIGFYFDVAAGWRWLGVYMPNSVGVLGAPSNTPGASDSSSFSKRTYDGFETLRLGIGMSIVVDPTFRLDLIVSGSAGYFSHVDGDSSCPVSNDGNACGSIPSDRRAVHSFGTFTIAGHWDL
jgi:hypothetical protein